MIILGIDCETTGVNYDSSEIVELGLVLYDTIRQLTISTHGMIFKTNTWSVKAEKFHTIPKEISDKGLHPDQCNPWDLVKHFEPEVIVAHFAEFDHHFVIRHWPDFAKVPWLCTKLDIKHSDVLDRIASTRLMHLAVDYGLNPEGWHRAGFERRSPQTASR